MIPARTTVADLERMARADLARDHVAVLAAPVGDQRQVGTLRRLGRQLAADDSLDVYLGPHDDVVALTVYFRAERDSRRGLGWMERDVTPEPP